MKADKLKKGLWKEFTRSPAKTAILLILVPVALYFCAPLFKGVLPKSRKTSGTKVVLPQAPFILPVEVAAVSLKPASPTWQAAADLIAKDFMTAAAELPRSMRDPFAEHVDSGTNNENEGTVNVDSVDDTKLIEDLELRLTTTLVAGGHKVATINGRTFREGDAFIEIAHRSDGSAVTIELTLSRVGRREVMLVHNTHTRRLQIKDEGSDHVIVVEAIAN